MDKDNAPAHAESQTEKIAENTALKMWSRIAMVFVVPLMLTLVGIIATDMRADIKKIKEDIEPFGVVKERSVEALTTAKAAKAESEQNAKQLASLESRQNHNDAENDRFQAALTKLAETVAALTSTVQVLYDDRQRAPPAR